MVFKRSSRTSQVCSSFCLKTIHSSRCWTSGTGAMTWKNASTWPRDLGSLFFASAATQSATRPASSGDGHDFNKSSILIRSSFPSSTAITASTSSALLIFIFFNAIPTFWDTLESTRATALLLSLTFFSSFSFSAAASSGVFFLTLAKSISNESRSSSTSSSDKFFHTVFSWATSSIFDQNNDRIATRGLGLGFFGKTFFLAAALTVPAFFFEAPAESALLRKNFSGRGWEGSQSRTAKRASATPSARILPSTAAFGMCILSMLKYLPNLGSSFRGGPKKSGGMGFVGSRSSNLGTKAFSPRIFASTAAFGICIFNIWKYLPYLGCSAAVFSFFDVDVSSSPPPPPPKMRGLPGSRFKMLGSMPSAFILASTAPRGTCILSMAKNLPYFGSSAKRGGPLLASLSCLSRASIFASFSLRRSLSFWRSLSALKASSSFCRFFSSFLSESIVESRSSKFFFQLNNVFTSSRPSSKSSTSSSPRTTRWQALRIWAHCSLPRTS
mmetsp:Transcript_19719/g.63394  ORF Transcript_19719/g.63394 Transcript_19719/m.63394 type:complete len:499 (+) Transcript_19719:1648-3144(+)